MGAQRKVKLLVGLVVIANLVLLLIVILGAFGSPPPKPLPNPNGYDDFVKAGKMVSGNAGDYSNMTPEQLASLVATNAEALKLVRIGLSRECRVRNDYTNKFMDYYLDYLAGQKRLALNLCAEGRLAVMQKRTNDAVQSFLDAERFGIECCRGGVMISKLVGIACESLGRSGLRPLADNLDAEQSRKIAQTLASLDTKEDSLKDCLEQERDFAGRTGTIMQKLAALILYRQHQKMIANFTAKFQKNQRERRLLVIDAATRAYALEKGKPPASVNDLVPDYLPIAPKDPVTDADLGLRASGN